MILAGTFLLQCPLLLVTSVEPPTFGREFDTVRTLKYGTDRPLFCYLHFHGVATPFQRFAVSIATAIATATYCRKSATALVEFIGLDCILKVKRNASRLGPLTFLCQ